jgi:hypothetical protein
MVYVVRELFLSQGQDGNCLCMVMDDFICRNLFCFILQNRIPIIGLVDHKPLLCGSLISVRRKASTPINTVIMFVPQQEVNVGVFMLLVVLLAQQIVTKHSIVIYLMML